LKGARSLQKALKEQILGMEGGNECLYDLIEWLREAVKTSLEEQEIQRSKYKESAHGKKVQDEADVYPRLWFMACNHLFKGPSHKTEKQLSKDLKIFCKEEKCNRAFIFYGTPALFVIVAKPGSFADLQKHLKHLGKPATLTKSKTLRSPVDLGNEFREKLVEIAPSAGGGCDKDKIRDLAKVFEIRKSLDVLLGVDQRRGIHKDYRNGNGSTPTNAEAKAKWLRETQDGELLLTFRVKPNSSRTELDCDPKFASDELLVRVSAPPEKGKANKELCRWIALVVGVPFSAVTLQSGVKSKRKVIKVSHTQKTDDTKETQGQPWLCDTLKKFYALASP